MTSEEDRLVADAQGGQAPFSATGQRNDQVALFREKLFSGPGGTVNPQAVAELVATSTPEQRKVLSEAFAREDARLLETQQAALDLYEKAAKGLHGKDIAPYPHLAYADALATGGQ